MAPNNNAESFENLLGIMNELRAKCPWDKKQTLESLRHLTIEETYELTDAILDGDLTAIKEELGDLMLHIVFYSKIAAEQEAFDIADVINELCDKLIYRHPHVFGDSNVVDAEEVKKNWEVLKLKDTGVLAGVPKSLPALIKAQRIQEKLSGIGFDWQYKEQVWEKVEEEMEEFKQSLQDNNSQNMEAEFGNLLFSLVNYSRFMAINPETALEKANKKIIKRFNYIEFAIKRDNKLLPNLTLAEMNAYWEEAA